MVILFDRFEELDDLLIETLDNVEVVKKSFTLSDMAFLPSNVESIYDYCIAKRERKTLQERKVYYAFIDVPDFWQVRVEGLHGAIYDKDQKKATVYVREPLEKRYVERVEWLSPIGYVYRIDYYNRYGYVYCQAFFNSEGNLESKTYYTSEREEVINVNCSNGVVTVFEHGCACTLFANIEEFEVAMMEEIAMKHERIAITSANLIQKMAKIKDGVFHRILFAMRHERDIQFYRENGIARLFNSKLLIFNNYETRFCVADEKSGEYMVSYGKNQYPQMNEKPDVLILTTSDVLCGIDKLTDLLPEIGFHIAANTLVSQKLIDLEKKKNVFVYPQVSKETLERLFQTSEYYLDINAGMELYHAIIKANANGMLILGYPDTLHNRAYVLDECIVGENEVEALAEKLRNLSRNENVRQKAIMDQQEKNRSTIRNIMR